MAATPGGDFEGRENVVDIEEALPCLVPMGYPHGAKRFRGFSENYQPKRITCAYELGSRLTRSRSNSNSSSSMASGSSFTGSRDWQCVRCPLKLTNGRKLYASAWSERLPMMLRWIPGEFPSIYDTFHQDTLTNLDLPGDAENHPILRRSCLMPIIQWLLEAGEFEPPEIKKSEVSTITVSERVKDDILQELAGSYFCKIAMAITDATRFVPVRRVTANGLQDIIMGVPDVPATYREAASNVFIRWHGLCKGDRVRESEITLVVHKLVSFLLASEDLIPSKLYEISCESGTRREFEMCGLKNAAENDVEIRIARDGPHFSSDLLYNYKVLTFAENKANMYGLDAAYPQMVCQFGAAAKHARFHTNAHHILYSVSLCGRNTVLLARAHVWKNLINRAESCIADEPALENSHFLYRNLTRVPDDRCFDVFPLLTAYMAIKAVTLLHLKTPFPPAEM